MRRRGRALRRRFGRANPSESSFERGWVKAIAMWKDGITWELITHKADTEMRSGADHYARGMVAAVEAMSGWLDLARREAKMHGVSESVTENLIARARAA